MPRLLNKPFVVEAKTDAEKTALCQGVRIYLKNMKAGVGTAKGLDDSDVATKWEKTAEHLEQGLVARLNEQSDAFSDGVGPTPLLDQEQEEPAGVGA